MTSTVAHQQLRGTDLALYMPYYEFPRGTFSYYPVVTLVDGSGEQVDRVDFTSTVIASTNHPAPESGIVIRDVTARFEDSGVTYFIDMDTIGYSNQELDVFLYFSYYNDTLIQMPSPLMATIKPIPADSSVGQPSPPAVMKPISSQGIVPSRFIFLTMPLHPVTIPTSPS